MSIETAPRLELIKQIQKLEEENKRLSEQNKKLLEQNQTLQKLVDKLSGELLKLEKRVAGIKNSYQKFLPFKGNTKKKSEERKNRNIGYGRKKDVPDEIVRVSLERCPDCQTPLPQKGSIHHTHQIIDIPLQKLYTVTEYQAERKWCPRCKKSKTAKIDLGEQILGSSRFSIKVMGFMAVLKEVYRLPIGKIKELCSSLYGLSVSEGEISESISLLAETLKDDYSKLIEEIKKSGKVNVDETSWRELGQNGWLWGFINTWYEFFVIRKTRSSEVPKQILKDFSGITTTDFYSAYNCLPSIKQRCWAHLLRDFKDLTNKYPKNKKVSVFAKEVKNLYGQAANLARDPPLKERILEKLKLETEIEEICGKYQSNGFPGKTLAKRLLKYKKELFTFVVSDIDPTNNAAERGLRHAVVSRKISGGTRSPRGSEAKAILMSLFGTWKRQDLNPLNQTIFALQKVSTAGV